MGTYCACGVSGLAVGRRGQLRQLGLHTLGRQGCKASTVHASLCRVRYQCLSHTSPTARGVRSRAPRTTGTATDITNSCVLPHHLHLRHGRGQRVSVRVHAAPGSFRRVFAGVTTRVPNPEQCAASMEAVASAAVAWLVTSSGGVIRL